MEYTKEALEEILQNDFIDNPHAFGPGARNNDVVDSMCICHALDKEWTEMMAKHCDLCDISDASYERFIKPHYERIRQWLEDKESNGYERGSMSIMAYAINY